MTTESVIVILSMIAAAGDVAENIRAVTEVSPYPARTVSFCTDKEDIAPVMSSVHWEESMMDFMELLKTRRTYRRFNQSKPIPEQVVRDMKEALRLSSSACNLQPLQYIFIRKPEIVEAIFPHTHWAAALPKELGTPKPGKHPVMYVAVFYDATSKTKWIDTDAGIAISNITLTAWSHGVGSCIMDNVDRGNISRILQLPKTAAIQSMIAFGYPTHTSTVVFPKEDGRLNYYLDENNNYNVPKRNFEDFIYENQFAEPCCSHICYG